MNNADLSFDLAAELKRISNLLPPQGPIKDLVAQNPLGAFLETPYDDAVAEAGQAFNARSYMDLNYYRTAFETGFISERALNEAIKYYIPAKISHQQELIRRALFDFVEVKHEETLNFLAQEKAIPLDLVKSTVATIHAEQNANNSSTCGILDLIVEQVGPSFDHHVHQILFRLIGAYMDQGVSLWSYFDKKLSFLDAVSALLASSKLPLAPFIDNHDLHLWLKKAPTDSLFGLLAHILADKALYAAYLQENVLAHCGWSAMLKSVTANPAALAEPCDIDLTQMLVLKLGLQWQYLKRHKPAYRSISLHDLQHAKSLKSTEVSSNTLGMALMFLRLGTDQPLPSKPFFSLVNERLLQKIWHFALEQSYYQSIGAMFDPSKKLPQKPKDKTFQAIFCIDDRECSFRRILEHESPTIETFGTAGFFGVDFFFEPPNKSLQKMCPLPMTPKHVVREHLSEDDAPPDKVSIKELASFMSRHGANSTIIGLISAYTFGHLSMFSLMASLLHPFTWLKAQAVKSSFGLKDLLFERNDEKTSNDGLLPGFTHQEMADRVFGTLNAIALKDSFAPMVFVIGHGSSSVNNPHFAAYDCGACSAKPGALNARLFALMANKKPVRELVKTMGITIPENTHFIGAFHDTCSDNVEFFDTDELSVQQQELFSEFKSYLHKTQEKNALERCRKFSLVSPTISPDKALLEVQLRAQALFEPRPELGHATNALGIVGRRMRSDDKNFDRRCFLQSYNPHNDPEGTILNGILQAFFPVCGGINLLYHFSRLDPAIYGCGTKLSHNVCSLLGVGNGLDDDLRTGLPVQMTELHIPIRLLVIIEQYPEIILKTVSNNASIWPWMKNAWLRVAALSPDSNDLKIYEPQTNSFTSFNLR